MSDDEMAGRHHRCDGHELGQTSGDGEGQGGLACCSPWVCKEPNTSGQLNNSHNGFFGEMSRSSVHFLIGLFAFLILSCTSCLYIWGINPLSVDSFVIIFSLSEGCLFILFMVSFAVQKLLSLIGPIFFFISITLRGGS